MLSLDLIRSILRPRDRAPTAHVRARARVEYETLIINADGTLAARRAPKRNLIYDQGLDMAATTLWPECFRYCAVGTGTRAVKRDSGAITFSRSGTTVTASAGFFEAADVGRLLKFDSGEEMYITAYTDTQNVTVGTSGTLAASEGTIWYVNDTGHQTESARTGNCSTGAGECESTFSVDTITHKRTFLFPAVGGSVTYKEIGWSNSGSAGNNLFGRDLIPGGGDALVAGQQYKVIVRLYITLSPATSTAVSDVGNNGFNTAGNAQMQDIGGASTVLAAGAFAVVASDGTTTAPGHSVGVGGLEPSVGCVCNVETATYTPNAGITLDGTNVSGAKRSLANLSYTNGTFRRDTEGTYTVSEANGSIYGLSFGPALNAGGTQSTRAFTVKFTSTQTKDNLHTLKVTLRKSWGRTLVN